MHHPCPFRFCPQQLLLPLWLAVLLLGAPDLAMAQASPFMTGATSLQTKGRTLLAAATRIREAFPTVQIRAFALVRTLGAVSGLRHLLEPCKGQIRWREGDAYRCP